MRNFFNIETAYRFEWNDLRAFTTLVNVVLIILFGLQISWFGLAIAVFGLVRDFVKERRISGILMHLSGVVLNLYFIMLLYRG
jgi:threonine/homoserine/homoserine lactone efflux protein